MHLLLRQKVNAAILITFLLTAIIFVFIQLPFQKHSLQRRIDQIEILLHTLINRDREELANEIFDKRSRALSIRLKEMRNVDGIVAIAIFDDSGKLIVGDGLPASESGIDRETMDAVRQGTHIKKLKWGTHDTLLYSDQIKFLGENMGFIQVYYSLAVIQRDQRVSLGIFAGLLVAMLVMMLAVLNEILSKTILQPMHALNTATRRIVQGDLDQGIDMPRKDELGSLATNFDTMRIAIKEQMSDLHRAKETYRQLYQKAPVMLLTVDARWRVIEANDRCLAFFGQPSQDVIDHSAARLLEENSRQFFSQHLLPRIASGELVQDEVYALSVKGGAVRHVLVSFFSRNDADGRMERTTISLQDITALINAEEELKLRETQLRLITDNMVDVISQTDADINIVYTSPSVERVFGYAPEDLVGRPSVELIHPDDIEPTLAQASAARKNKAKSLLIKYRWRHADGHYVWVESATRLLYDPQGQSAGAVFGTRDITYRMQVEDARLKLEKQLLQTQKLEAIGHLAGGVAHDLNNLLSPILGYAELLLQDKSIASDSKIMLEQIEKAGIGARDLVRQLLAFSRKQTLEYKHLDVNHVLKGFENLIRRTLPEDIEMAIIESPHPLLVSADRGQLEQVIMNLSINAADAMHAGGKLTIETDIVTLDETYVSKHQSVKEGTYVMLSVSDTGIGMDEETQSKIFEPFFSTKGKKGTGLGLATVYGIVKQHDGNVWVYSEPDKGTTVKVYLPVDESIATEQDDPAVVECVRHGDETILLVEDNQQVRELARTILEQQGYTVWVAEDGTQAVQLLEQRADSHVHLLLTDVVLPNLNGREVYERALKTRPNLKVLYMSGYTDNVIAHRGVLDEGVNFIQKPFSVQVFCSKVSDVLDAETI